MIDNLAGGGWLALAAAPLIGSFAGVVITRLPSDETVVFGRSRCLHCDHPLAARDLVPLLSWAATRGRCRYCAAPLGLFYPAIEIGAIAVAAWAALLMSGWLLWATCALGWTLLVLAVIDHRHLLLPDALTLPLIAGGLIVSWLIEPGLVVVHAIGAAAGLGAFFALALAYRALRGRDGLGFGDAKLMAAAGAWLGWQGLPGVVLIASVAALVVVVTGRLAQGKLNADRPIPFGPYICLAIWLVWLYGLPRLG